MKKVTMFLLAVLFIASLFVSCDTNTNAVLDEHVTVSFSTGSDGRSLGYEIENITNLRWHYSANKTSSEDPFKYGETSDTILANFSTQIELSQGKWNFTLWANKVDESGTEGAKVYEGSVTGVLITHETSPKTIVINVSPEVAGESGSIVLQDITVSLKDGSSTTVYPQVAIIEGVENGELTLTNGCSAEKTGLQAGDYSVTVKYTEDIDGTTVTYASEKIVVTVWSGRTTTIKGNLSEITGSATLDKRIIQTDITQVNTVSEGVKTEFAFVGLAPSNNTESKEVNDTVVTFPADTLSGGNAKLQVKVNSIDSDFSFSVPESPSTVGSISLKLNDQESSSFGESSVTITTYIAKGLSGVAVKYNGNGVQPGAVTVTTSTGSNVEGNYYESDTGKLVFSTNHFSEYYVVANKVEAYNTKTNTAYESFTDAYSKAKEDDTIKLCQDVNLSSVLQIGKSITIDGNGHSIYNTANRVIRITQPNLDVKLYDLGIISKCTAPSDVRGISFDDTSSGSSLLLDGCTVSASFYSINVLPEAENLNITIKNGTVAAGWAAINSYSNDSTFIIENSTLQGLNDKGESSWNDFATIVFDGNGLRNADNIGKYGSGNSMTISNSTVYASSESNNKQAWLAIQYGAQNNSITLSDTNIIDESGDDMLENTYIDSYVGWDNTAKKYAKSYDVHSELVVDGETKRKCYHGELDSAELINNGEHRPFEDCQDVARIDSNYYLTLAEAFEAIPDNSSATITLLKDSVGGGIKVVNSRNIDVTVDFAGHTYTCKDPAVGSTGTETQGFHFEQGNTFKFKNGALNVSTGVTGTKYLFQVYANLTLENMDIDGTNLAGNGSVVLSVNCGNVSIEGNTRITSKSDEYAIDASWWPSSYPNGATVNVNTTGCIKGKISLGAYGNNGSILTPSKTKLIIENITLEGTIDRVDGSSWGDKYSTGLNDEALAALFDGMCEITGGTFSNDPSAYVDNETHSVTKDGSNWKVQ